LNPADSGEIFLQGKRNLADRIIEC